MDIGNTFVGIELWSYVINNMFIRLLYMITEFNYGFLVKDCTVRVGAISNCCIHENIIINYKFNNTSGYGSFLYYQ